MNRNIGKIVSLLGILATACGCSPTSTQRESQNAPTLPPEPMVTYSASDAEPGQSIEHGELILDVADLAEEILED